MRDLVIQVLSVKGVKVNYLSYDSTRQTHELHHRARVKQAIYGGVFTYYNSEMDFGRSDILIDNRHT